MPEAPMRNDVGGRQMWGTHSRVLLSLGTDSAAAHDAPDACSAAATAGSRELGLADGDCAASRVAAPLSFLSHELPGHYPGIRGKLAAPLRVRRPVLERCVSTQGFAYADCVAAPARRGELGLVSGDCAASCGGL